MDRAWLTSSLALVAVAAGTVVACSASEGTGDFGSPENGGDNSSVGTGGPSGAGGGAGTGSGTGPGGPNPLPPPPDEENPVECAELDSSSPLVLYLSADDSNSMGSPVLARELIRNGYIPHGIRTYEFLNYYRFDYAPASPGDLNLVPQMAATADPQEFELQIGVRSYDAVTPRRPLTVTLVLDTSGSMSGRAIERERAMVRALNGALQDGDIVNVVTWSTSNNVLLSGHEIAGDNDQTLNSIADGLSANGGTDLNGGLVAGYALAEQHFGENRINRVILVSDGGANVGVTSADLIAEHSEDADSEGIYLMGVGTGPPEDYSDELMDIVTDEGRGAYVYLDSEAEAEHIFGERFDEVLQVAARGVQIELTAPWYFQMQRFYGEEFSTNPEEVKPQHLAPSDAMILNQVLRACDESVVNQADTIQVKATWKEPLTRQPRESTVTLTVGQLLSGNQAQLDKGRAIVAYAEALRSSDQESLHAALVLVEAANDGDADLDEIASLIETHPELLIRRPAATRVVASDRQERYPLQDALVAKAMVGGARAAHPLR